MALEQNKFKLHSEYKMTGDQPQAVEKLVSEIRKGLKHQTLMGVTGSGKTFTMANIIEQVNRPTLINFAQQDYLRLSCTGSLRSFSLKTR